MLMNRIGPFENRHLRGVSVYLVNALVSRDRDIRITHQNRNYEQSSYQMDHAQASVRTESPSVTLFPAWLGAAALLLMAPLLLLLRRPRRRAPV
jgi:hypothetical protein